jgi:hypothetical protein
MSYQLTTAAGSIEAVIDDNCGMKKFLSVANALAKDCKVKFISKENNSDTIDIDWVFSYKGHHLKLHYNIYNGVSICNSSSRGNNAVTELASILERKFF